MCLLAAWPPPPVISHAAVSAIACSLSWLVSKILLWSIIYPLFAKSEFQLSTDNLPAETVSCRCTASPGALAGNLKFSVFAKYISILRVHTYISHRQQIRRRRRCLRHGVKLCGGAAWRRSRRQTVLLHFSTKILS